MTTSEDRLAALEKRVERLEHQLAPKAPTPAPKLPAWANGNPDTGVNAKGPPAPQVHTPHEAPWPRRLPGGGNVWRNSAGEIVPDPNTLPPPRVQGLEHTAVHQRAMALVDEMLPLHGEK